MPLRGESTDADPVGGHRGMWGAGFLEGPGLSLTARCRQRAMNISVLFSATTFNSSSASEAGSGGLGIDPYSLVILLLSFLKDYSSFHHLQRRPQHGYPKLRRHKSSSKPLKDQTNSYEQN